MLAKIASALIAAVVAAGVASSASAQPRRHHNGPTVDRQVVAPLDREYEASGSTFAMGPTTVACTATDRSGNPVATRRTPNPGENPPPAIRKSLGRMNELGTLYSAIAGMLNLIAIIDAAWHGRRRVDQ